MDFILVHFTNKTVTVQLKTKNEQLLDIDVCKRVARETAEEKKRER